jgi:two-component system, NarL family, sensor histidine kinase DesK
MTPKTLIQCIREPPEDSLVGRASGARGKSLRSMPFVILLNLAWVFFWPVVSNKPFMTVILPTILSVPVFVYFHLCAYFAGGGDRARRWYIAGEFVVGYTAATFNLAALGYLIFGFFSLAFSAPIRTGAKIIFGSVVLFLIEAWLLGERHTSSLVSLGLPGVLLGISALYAAHTAHQQAHLRRSNEEIMRLATLAERERIGRDLHDLLGHTLSVVALKSELARKLIDRDLDAARAEITEVERVARDALSQVRNAVSGIRSTAIAAELQAATALLEAHGVKVKCETERVQLPHDRETALALSLREATTNIRRHAQATGVTIRLRQDPAQVVMEVVDDGRGGRIVPGNGLNGMRERLSSVGGSLTLEPAKDGGTRLYVSVPRAA